MRDYAAKYLKASFEDGDEAGFLLALRNVVEAHGAISEVARESKVTRQHLHRVLTDPEIDSRGCRTHP